MVVHYFAAARSAAGREEEHVELPGDRTLASLIREIAAVTRAEPPLGTPPLAQILSRSSFLLNGVSARDLSTALHSGDVLDVLPPFAGG